MLSGVTDEIVNIMGFSRGDFPVKYLGCPLQTRKVSISEYSSLLSKVERAIRCWSARALSYARRLQLVKSVLEGIMSFWDQIFILPTSHPKNRNDVQKFQVEWESF